tara:strand:- start:1311 stop:2600 length:1290 start_codon:yes stop_codon:yes gene_type:complete
MNQSKDEILKLVENYSSEKLEENRFIPGISKVPVSGKVINSKDINFLVDSCLDMWFTSGHYTEKFEKSISKFLGIRHTLMVNSGSSANLLAISALKILYSLNDGDEIITSAVGFPTTINPIIQNNLTPVLVDVDPRTLNIDYKKIEEKINDKTKGIVIAHTLGIPFDLKKIKDICDKYNLFLMEDNCDAFGSKFNNKLTGTFGDVSTLSFYPAHHITTGEGGAVCTNMPKLKKIIESLRDWGRDCYCPPGEDNTCKKRYEWQLGKLPYGYDHKYIYSHIGYNLKATDMQAALGLSQISKLPDFISARVKNYNYLKEKFKEFDMFEFPQLPNEVEPSWFGFPITINSNAKFTRHELLLYYDECLIGTRLMFGGNLILQPAYENQKLIFSDDLSNADYIANNSFWLGVYPGLTQEMLDYIYESTKTFIENN